MLYRSGPPNGVDFTPCCKLAGNTANRLASTVESCAKASELTAPQRQWLAATLASFRADQAAIWAEVEAARRRAGIDDKTHRGYVYWADGQMRPVHGWPEMRDLVVRQVVETFADKGGARDSASCAVCGREGLRVYGNYAVLACYNLNNPGSIAGGFRASGAHRNFPVCGDCALTISETLTFAETYLTSSMAGQTYLILPYSSSPEVREELRARLGQHPQRYSLGKARDLIADEFALTDEFAGYGDQIALAMIFFKKKNAAWRIQAEIQQVLPSRLHELHAAGKDIERATDLVAVVKGQDQPVRISALAFKNFTSASDKPSEETLRDWLAALFSGDAIERRHFLHALVAKLVAIGKRNASLLHWMTRQAWGFYRYASRVRLIVSESTEEHPAMADAVPDSPYGRYVREHTDFFRRPELVVAQYQPGYRLGALTRRIALTGKSGEDTALRSTLDFQLEVGELLAAWRDYPALMGLRVMQDVRLRCQSGPHSAPFTELADAAGLAVTALDL